MAIIYSLCSSSKGNATYVGNKREGILIDAGIGIRNFETSFGMAGLEPGAIRGIFITHEHSDHIKGLRKITDRYPQLPIYGSRGTLEALIQKDAVNPCCRLYEINQKMPVVGDTQIKAFPTSHDSAQSLGYRIFTADGKTVAVCTDLGFVSDTVAEHLNGCDFVLLESNYDEQMLFDGPYPYMLKCRISGSKGHLSNEMCAVEVERLLQRGTVHFALGHLSEENNRPELALCHTAQKLSKAGYILDQDYTLQVLPVRNSGQVIQV